MTTRRHLLIALVFICGLCYAQEDLDFMNLGKFYVVSGGVAWLIN